MGSQIAWVGGDHSDAIWQQIRPQFERFGFPDVELTSADIVCISAGDPFWVDPGHTMTFVESVLRRRELRVIIIERHEYGWSNYESADLRAQNAWLGVENYGRDTEAAGAKHGEKHFPLHYLCKHIDKTRLLYFRREFFRFFDYPDFVYPINFVLGPSPDTFGYKQFAARPLDVMCIWGETHPHRKIIGETLKTLVARGEIKGDIRSPVYAGDPGRLGGGEHYRRAHEQARMFITSDGHGLGGGREWELITTSVMVRRQSWMVLPDEFQHEKTCLDWGSPLNPDPTGLVNLLMHWKDRIDKLYEIYVAGAEHARRYHSAEARARYIIARMQEKGWI